MAETIAWDEGTVCLKTTAKEGATTYTEHRCWNVVRFVKFATSVAVEEGGSCSRMTREDFLVATKRTR